MQILFLVLIFSKVFEGNLLEMELDQAKISGEMKKCKKIIQQLEKYYTTPIYSEELPPSQITAQKPFFYLHRWGNDATVDTAFSYQSISMDVRSDSIIFIASSRQDSADDTFEVDVRFSSDGGSTWNWFATLGGDGYAYNLYNPSLKIVEADDSSYLFVAYEAEPVTNPSDGFIGIWRFNFNSWYDTSFFVSNTAGVKESDPSLDADDIQFPYAPYLYCVYEKPDSIIFARSLNRGKNWIDQGPLCIGNINIDYYDPECVYGWFNTEEDSLTIGVCWEYRHISGRKRVHYAFNWGFGNSFAWKYLSLFNPPANCIEFMPNIMMAHKTSGAVIFFTRNDTILNASKLVYKYTDNGILWQEGALDSNYTDYLYDIVVDDSCGKYYLFYSNEINANYTSAPYDSLSVPFWSAPIVINDSPINDSIPPASAVLSNTPMVCWVESGLTQKKIKFDAIWNTAGITDKNPAPPTQKNIYLYPNPTKRTFFLQLSESNNEELKIKIFDVAGKLIKEFNKNSNNCFEVKISDLAQGVYFVQVKTPRNKVNLKMVVTK